ncbi:putative glycosyltransferase [Caldithrix abyssi DSM 13497]|uniref:Glycosyl transferase family 2 n=1 Tax=Caldithrix abyssi DSM 13497 TaxID=880073 RepID=H1XS49_CALAY|nr:glycosyltransferase [Caldithrix abyssi]APF20152.1 Glycosyl transferase family 2 [Caldithrix abyssi DSM 13497]EHO40213.1 putative glycosyltransferase [Caldithrix abyssi DSM 13497]
MNFINKLYNKFRKHRQDEIRRIVRSEIIIQEIKRVAFSNKNSSFLNTSVRKEKIIVSFTTIKERIKNIYLVIESIAQQTMKPDKIVLWLSKKDFQDDNLPITLKWMMQRGLEVRYVEDIGPHTKLLYALKEFENYLIITIDDDIIYPIDLIENLYNTHKNYPKAICCNAAMLIKKDKKGNFLPYNEWPTITDRFMISDYLLPLGVDGVLYPSNSLDNMVFKQNLIKKLCPKADDIWFKIMSLKKGTEIILTGAYPDFSNYFIPLDTAYINALAQENIFKNLNDIQFQKCISYFNIKF